jgi:prepilin-type N-terminal cleavage/methylation domain-containing protein
MNEKIKNGYTLIEILVGLTIIGIIFGVGYVGFRDFSRRQLLQTASRMIKSDLRLAQSKALAGEKPNDARCTGTEVLNAYEFIIVDSDTYRVNAKCSGGDVEIKVHELGSDDMTMTSATNPIIFKVLGHGTNIPNPTEIISITQISTGRIVSVTVSQGGEIN